jgi:hypothetical protein
MRNTYNVTLLRKRILDALPRALSPAGEAAVEGFLSLPGASAWQPDRIGLKELSFVFDLGVPASLIGPNESARALLSHIGDAARDGQPPNATSARVLHAAALLTRWGSRVEFAPEARAPRFELRTSDASFEVWIARAGDTDAQSVPQEFATSERSRLIMAEVTGTHEGHAATLDATFAASSALAAVVLFEPRFWIGIEQKEWLYLARVNPHGGDTTLAESLGDEIGVRHALRIPLLI